MSVYARKIESADSEQLRINLKALIDEKRLSVNRVAKSLGLPMMTIRRLLSGETIDPRISTLKHVADYFGITVDDLFDAHTSYQASRFPKPTVLPVFSWEQLEQGTQLTETQMISWQDWQPVPYNPKHPISNRAFALNSQPSMHPRFPQNTTLIIDPQVTPDDGDTVLIKLKKRNAYTLRQLSIDPPDWQLHSVTGSKTINFNPEEHAVTGVMLMTMLYSRQR